MSSADGPRFEDTMAVLEEEREATEGRFRELLGELTGHVADVRAAAERSTALHRGRAEARHRAPAAAGDGLGEAAGDSPRRDEVAWPAGGTGLRGIVNRLAGWLGRDFLQVLDRRNDLLGRRVEELGGRVDTLQEVVSANGESSAALNEALAGAHAALQAALATHNEMLTLVNAKDAELLQRAVAGPLRRMEVLFDEFSRQQEALLSQLVGRRRELDELVRTVAPAPEEQM